jgi:hypothetical protein
LDKYPVYPQDNPEGTPKTTNCFAFQVEATIQYKIEFSSANHYFKTNQEHDLYDVVFGKVNSVTDQSKNLHKVAEKVRYTILATIAWYMSTKNRFLFFVCDSTDKKESARAKLFTKWADEIKNFETENFKPTFEVSELVDTDGDIYHVGFIAYDESHLEFLRKEIENPAILQKGSN